MVTTVLTTKMTCGGCSGACTRILGKVEGVEKVDASLDDQTLTVTHSSAVTPEALTKSLEKWASAKQTTVTIKSSE
eukprot:maker-scaffold_3-snap-gene-9.50-mRNA-1 protein AED:0.11 eAED:0.11 QI:101/1/1/1/1/1/2/938/75